MKLMVPCLHIIPISAICNSILASNKLYWMYKYNVLLILKTMLVEGKRVVEEAGKKKMEEGTEVQVLAAEIEEVKRNKKVLDNVCK